MRIRSLDFIFTHKKHRLFYFRSFGGKVVAGDGIEPATQGFSVGETRVTKARRHKDEDLSTTEVA
jgi:hypothetical protein